MSELLEKENQVGNPDPLGENWVIKHREDRFALMSGLWTKHLAHLTRNVPAATMFHPCWLAVPDEVVNLAIREIKKKWSRAKTKNGTLCVNMDEVHEYGLKILRTYLKKEKDQRRKRLARMAIVELSRKVSAWPENYEEAAWHLQNLLPKHRLYLA